MHRSFGFLVALVLAASVVAAEKGTALLVQKDFADFDYVADKPADIATVCKLKDDGVVAIIGSPIGYIATKATHKNYRLHAEWRWSGAPGNSGVLVHITGGPKDRQWPLSLQVQTKNKAAGDLLPMAGFTFSDALTSPAGAAVPLKAHTAPDSEKPVGEWNSADIVCRGDTVEVTINGVVQNKVAGCMAAEGKIGFQLEGVPFELRNVRLEPL